MTVRGRQGDVIIRFARLFRSVSVGALLWLSSPALLHAQATTGAVTPGTAPAPEAEPSTAAVEAARRALREERVATQLSLSDAWMLHLAEEDRELWGRWGWGAAALGLYGAIWGVSAGATGVSDAPLALTTSLAVIAGYDTAAIFIAAAIDDPKQRLDFILWSAYANLTAAGVVVMTVPTMENWSGSDDGSAMVVLLGAASVGLMLSVMIGELVYPTVWTAPIHPHYLSLPDDERGAYALQHMLRRDATVRKRNLYQFSVSMSIATVLASTIPAFEDSDARLITGVAALGIAVPASIAFIVSALSTRPSEHLMLGRIPFD